jgi:hypothetical protein
MAQRPRPDPDTVAPTRAERWLERRFGPYRFGVVLLLLLATFVVMAIGPGGKWARVATVVLEGVTLLMTLVASRTGRLWFRIGLAIVVIAILSALASVAVSSSAETTAGYFALNVLLIAGAPVAIATALFARDLIDIRTVLGAICIYLLIGIMYAFLYACLSVLESAQFFVQTAKPGLPVSLYFSFVTQTTVGYGDYTTATNLGHTLAVTQALLGQLYLVTVIAMLVGRLAPRRSSREE